MGVQGLNTVGEPPLRCAGSNFEILSGPLFSPKSLWNNLPTFRKLCTCFNIYRWSIHIPGQASNAGRSLWNQAGLPHLTVGGTGAVL